MKVKGKESQKKKWLSPLLWLAGWLEDMTVSESARQTSSVSEQGRELKVEEDNALLFFLLLEPGRGPALADNTMQINAADNMFLLPKQSQTGGCTCAFTPQGNVCCVVKTLRHGGRPSADDSGVLKPSWCSGICESPATISNNWLHNSGPDFFGGRISLYTQIEQLWVTVQIIFSILWGR